MTPDRRSGQSGSAVEARDCRATAPIAQNSPRSAPLGDATNNLLIDAMDFLQRGWSCIPMRLSLNEKKPGVRWGIFQKRKPTEEELRDWFGASSKFNGLAVITGEISNSLAVRDFDDVSGYERWRDNNPTLARELPTSRTLRGYHVWHISDLTKTVKLADGEYRAGRAITVTPHSIRPTAEALFVYDWTTPLPKGRLPTVEHVIFTGGIVAEPAECHSSAHSALSALSATFTVDELITATLPKKQAERNAFIFHLARGLKLNLGITDVDALRAIVHRWYSMALPAITTKDFDTTWSDFLYGFSRAHTPLGEDLMDVAASLVDPNDLPVAAERYDSEPVRRLVGLCAAIARVNQNGGRFFASSHDLSPRLGVAPVQAWRFLKMLIADGVIECLDPGNRRSAARFRWLGGETDQREGPPTSPDAPETVGAPRSSQQAA